VLQDGNWRFALKGEQAVRKQLLLFANSECAFIERLHLRCVSKLLIDYSILGDAELLAGYFLKLLHLSTVIMLTIDQGNFHRVGHSNVSEELVVDEPEERDIEFGESAHYLEVDIERSPLIELIRGDPSDWLAHDLNAIVDTFDREEGLGKVLGDRTVEHKVAI